VAAVQEKYRGRQFSLNTSVQPSPPSSFPVRHIFRKNKCHQPDDYIIIQTGDNTKNSEELNLQVC
jgi:hypothetical protein